VVAVISEWFLGLATMIGAWFVGLVPAEGLEPPAEVWGLDATISGFLAPFSGLSVWVPWALVFFCAGMALLVWGVGWGVKGIAWLWGQVPVVGGAG